MNLPNILQEFLKAQELLTVFLSLTVFLNRHPYLMKEKYIREKEEIRQWNEKSNSEYKTLFEVKDFSVNDNTTVLRINISGSFDGSPVMLNFHFRTKNDLITALAITE